MFRKHGFYHVHTIEDDRSRGVHSYLFARSFSRVSFKQPVTCLCIAGCGVTVINFAKTLFSFTKDTPDCKGQLAFVMINDPCISTEGKSEIVEGFVSGQLPGTASHLMFTDMAMYRSGWVKEIKCAAEVPDMRAICGNVLDNKDKRWLLAGRSPDQLKLTWDMDNVLLPDEANAARMGDIVADIAAGTTTPAYYKEELVKMTVDNNCDGVLLGSAELHSMFGIDRAFNGIEIFDPLLELAIIVQNNRLK